MGHLRRAAALTVVGAVAAGLLTGSSALAGDVDIQVVHTCGFPSGDQQTTMRIRATLPDTAVVDDIVIPTGAIVTVSVPRPVLDELSAQGAVSVAADTELLVNVDDSGTAVESYWFLPAPATPIPAEGELPLDATGDGGAVLPMNVGALLFVAADLTLTLNAQREDGSSLDPVRVTCTLNVDQDGFLGIVIVEDGDIGPPPGTPEECGDIPPIGEGLATGCSFVTGYSNVTKLNGAVRINPALMNIALNNFEFEDGNLLIQNNVGDLPAGGLPPATGTFLAFGFMPIKATMEMLQVGPIPVRQVAQGVPPFDYYVEATARMDLRVRDVMVNGMPLDVGPNCRSAEPMVVKLVGGTPEYTNILFGGPLYGIATIPPFSGCGVSEDLDPLLSGSVSGPGNYVRMQQGNICAPSDPWFCPPVVSEPTLTPQAPASAPG
ncbi:MAG TPA: DUF6801 domain-containing protein [Pseudonocardiaceae bacterium]